MRASLLIPLYAPMMLAAQWSVFEERMLVQDDDGGGGPGLKHARHPDGFRTVAFMTQEGSLQLVRTDQTGVVLWHERVHPAGSTPPYWLYDAVPLPDNGVALLIGYSITTGLFDVLRFDASGGLVLSTQHSLTPLDSAAAIGIPNMISLPSGNLVLAAQRSGSVVVAELEANGALAWSTGFQPLDGGSSAHPSSLASALNGDILVAGSALFGPRFIARLDSEGILQWSKRYFTAQAPAYDWALPLNDGNILWLSWPDGGPSQMARMDAEGTIIDYWTLDWPSNPYQQPLLPKNAFVQPDGSVICESSIPSFVMRIGPDGTIQDALQLDFSTPHNWMAHGCASWNGDSLSFAMLFQDTIVFNSYLSMELSGSTVPHSCWLEPAMMVPTPAVLNHNTAVGHVDDPISLLATDIAYVVEALPIATMIACGGVPLGTVEKTGIQGRLLILNNPTHHSNGIAGYAEGGTLLDLIDARGLVLEHQRVGGTGPHVAFKFKAAGLVAGLYFVRDRDAASGRTLDVQRVVVE